MTYADMFSEVKGMLAGADVSDIHEHLAYQFNIIGEAEGIFYAEVKEGKLYIEPYEYFDRDVMFISALSTPYTLWYTKTSLTVPPMSTTVISSSHTSSSEWITFKIRLISFCFSITYPRLVENTERPLARMSAIS